MSKTKTIRRGTREVIFNVFIRCLAEFQAGRLLSEIDNVYERTAEMTGKSVATVRRIAEEGEKNDGVFATPGKRRQGRPSKDMDTFDMCAIRQKVLYFYTVKKQIPTLRFLLPIVRDELGYNGSRENLRKTLLALGFCYKKRKNDQPALLEKPRIAANREEYLKKILENRNLPEELQKNIIYLDECYVHSSYKLVKCWQEVGISGGIKHNIIKGKRCIVMVAGGEQGFVPNTMLIVSGTNKKEDFSSEMNHHNFNKWVEENVIPNLSGPSIIVLDNAPYHRVLTNKVPTTAKNIQEIKLWLLQNNIKFDPTLSKPELLMLIKRHKPKPIYEIDQVFAENGHTVLRLPPYHCDLNPMELIWAVIKHKIMSLNGDITDIRHVTEQAINTITLEDWKSSCQQIIEIEKDYYEKGHTLYDDLDNIAVNLVDDDSSSSSGDEYEAD